jgi:MFS family permease
MILLVAAIGLTGFIPGVVGLIGVILIKFAFYFCDTPIKVIINNQIDNRLRASIFSVANLLASLMLAGSRPLVGFIAKNTTNRFAFQIWFYIGLVFIPIVAAAIVIVQKLELQKKVEEEGEKQIEEAITG